MSGVMTRYFAIRKGQARRQEEKKKRRKQRTRKSSLPNETLENPEEKIEGSESEA
jgi:hypothetical protein